MSHPLLKLLLAARRPEPPPGGGGGTVAVDNFDRADEELTASPNWFRASPYNWPMMQIVSGELYGTSSHVAAFLWSTPATTTDQYAEIDMWGNRGEGGLVLCHNGSPSDFDNGYRLLTFNWYNQIWLYRNGVRVATWSGNTNPNAYQRWRLEKQGDTIRCYLNGFLVGTYTDPSPLGGGYFGIEGGSDNNGRPRYDNFAGGDL